MKNFFSLLLILGVTGLAVAQDTYVRPSVSLINMNFNNGNSSANLNEVDVPKNLDGMNMSVAQFSVQSDNSAEANDAVMQGFTAAGGPASAVSAILPSKDGMWDMSTIKSRAEYSATDQDVNLTSGTMRGAGSDSRYHSISMEMLDKNYVLALNMGNPSPHVEKDLTGRQEVGRGFKQDITFYVLKVVNPFIVNPGLTPQDLGSTDISVEVVASGSSSLTAYNRKEAKKKKSDAQLKSELRASLFQAVWDASLQQVDGWQPKTTLEAKKRIALGTKENLKIDNRFFVFENVQNELGEVVKKKTATMRVKSVGNNDGVSTGDSERSVLYKIGYGSAKEGMLVQQKEDTGIGVSVGYGSMSWIRLDYRLKMITPGLMVFVDIHPFPGKVEFNKDVFLSQGAAGYLSQIPGIEAGTFTALALNAFAGVEKQTYFSSAFYVSPFVGAGYSMISLSGDALTAGGESIPWDSSEGMIYGAVLGTGGARVGVQFTSEMSFNVTLGYSLPVIGGWMDPAMVDTDGTLYYNLGTSLSWTEAQTDQEILEAYYDEVVEEMPAVPSGFVWSAMLRYEF